MNYNIKVSSALESQQPVTRRVLFPDGLERLITLERRLWDLMAWLAENDGSGTEQDTVDIAYQLATEFHDLREMSFEEQIRESLYHSITGGVRAVLESRDQIFQDNAAFQTS